jgi:hypothetical protein
LDPTTTIRSSKTVDDVTVVSGPKLGSCSCHSIVNPCPAGDAGGVVDAVGSTPVGVELENGLGVVATTVVGDGVGTNVLGSGEGEAGASGEQAINRTATDIAGSVSLPTVIAMTL